MPYLVHVARLQGSGDEKVISVCVAPEGSNVKANVVVATSTSVSTWTEKGEATYVRRKLGAVEDSIKGVAVTKEGYVIGSCSDGSTKAWGIDNGSSKVSKIGGDGKSGGRCLGLTHDGLVIGGGADGSVTIRTQQGKLVKGGTINAHKDAIVSVFGSPSVDKPYFATASLDGTVKIYTMEGMKRLHTLKNPSTTSKATSVIISPDGSLCATGHKDGKCVLFDAITGGHLWEYDMEKPISQICFSPTRYWMCAATTKGFKILDLENKHMVHEDTFQQDHVADWMDVDGAPDEEERRRREDAAASSKSPGPKSCTSLCWSNDGEMLYVGYENGDVHVYKVRE